MMIIWKLTGGMERKGSFGGWLLRLSLQCFVPSMPSRRRARWTGSRDGPPSARSGRVGRECGARRRQHPVHGPSTETRSAGSGRRTQPAGRINTQVTRGKSTITATSQYASSSAVWFVILRIRVQLLPLRRSANESDQAGLHQSSRSVDQN